MVLFIEAKGKMVVELDRSSDGWVIYLCDCVGRVG